MKRILLFGILLLATFLLGTAGANHYLFLRRLSDTDLKSFYHRIQTFTTAKTEAQRAAAIQKVRTESESGHFDVAFVGDNVLLFHTSSFFSEAYLVAHRIGEGDAWAVGWLRDGKFSRVSTFTPPTNLGGS